MDTMKITSRLRILLVEDEEFDRVAFHRAFEKSKVPCEITECIRAEDALERLSVEASSFDLAVVDHALPGMSGLDLCKELLAKGTPLPLVILTGRGSEGLAVQALKAGVDDYVVKDSDQNYLHLLPLVLPEVVRNHENRLSRGHAEQALRESQEKYRTVLEASPDPIVVYDMEGRVNYFNTAFTKVFGWTLKELLGKKIDYVPKESWPETEEMIDKVLKGKSFSAVRSRRYTKKGKTVDVSISVATYRDINGNPAGSIHILRDITKRKRLEAQLQQAQKMEAIGTLAGGIAHDFNNLLMGIQGNVSLMLIDMDHDHPHYNRLKNIEKQVESGARLTTHLLGYARKGRYEVKPVDLNHLVKQTAETFGRTRKQIAIYCKLAEDLSPVEADTTQIDQVLLNLFVNAADAMPAGGDLVLKTRNVTHKDIHSKLYKPKPGNYVLLTVTDTGRGMDSQTMERIFDPFFTTKEMGRGTGLGLPSAYGIIKAHGGYVDVDSKIGQGTTFSIYLPRSEETMQEVATAAHKVSSGTETILLVDDEEMILEVAKDLLEAMGYKVLIAQEGKEAVELYKANWAEIDLVLLDMVMPNMGGGALYDRMKEINPDVKALLSSGFSIDGEATEILERGCNGFIQKPFTMKELSRKIREVLD